VSQGRSVAEAIRAVGVTGVTYYRWRREFGGLKSGQVKRLRELEAENARCLAWLPAARTRGDPAGLRRLARGATPTGLAGLADRGAQTDAELLRRPSLS
jgi:hypothetical protein